MVLKSFDADPDPGSGIFLTLDPGSGMEKIQIPGYTFLIRITVQNCTHFYLFVYLFIGQIVFLEHLNVNDICLSTRCILNF
jgi:hypothetical protein